MDELNNAKKNKVKTKTSKELLYYFSLSIIIVVMFVSVVIGIAVFTPKNVVVKIWAYDNKQYYTYRSPVEGRKLYTYIGRITVEGHVFEGYYFKVTSQVVEGKNVLIYDEKDRIPEDYVVNKNITIYCRWVEG